MALSAVPDASRQACSDTSIGTSLGLGYVENSDGIVDASPSNEENWKFEVAGLRVPHVPLCRRFFMIRVTIGEGCAGGPRVSATAP